MFSSILNVVNSLKQLVKFGAIGASLVCAGCEASDETVNRVESELTRDADLRDGLVTSFEREIEAATPITDAQILSSRLKVPENRFNVPSDNIVSGDIVNLRSGHLCAPGVCICKGDVDCNDMFSSVCRSPSTGGKCYESSSGAVICTCFPKLLAE